MDQLLERLRRFRDDRNWAQFHSPKNLAMSVSIEAAELLEHFQWSGSGDLEPGSSRHDARSGGGGRTYLSSPPL